MKLWDATFRFTSDLGTVVVTFGEDEAVAEIDGAAHTLAWRAERKSGLPLPEGYRIPPSLDSAEWFAQALLRSLREDSP